MILLPAIDIRNGRAVRLLRGSYEHETVYASSPLEAARTWVEAGAHALHVVDLDGAREGWPVNLEHLRAVSRLGVPVQYGGGLRSVESVWEALEAGAARVVLGTAAHRDPALLDSLVAAYGERVAVAVDVRDGRVSVAGWTETAAEGITPEQVLVRLGDHGVRNVVYTSVDRDGTLEGLDPEEVRRAAEATPWRLIYSGGVASLDDLRALAALELPALDGVIAGKALYEGRFTVEEAADVLGGEPAAWS